MLPEIELDVLRYLDRTSLEGLQMHSRYSRDLVNRQAHTFPLRDIHEVIEFDTVSIQLLENDSDEIEVVASSERNLELLFHRVNNAFIQRFETGFRLKDASLLYYLRANANKLQCQIKALVMDDTSYNIDFDLVDFLGLHLKPQVYETAIYDRREDYATLFAHNSLRGSVKHLVYEVSR